MEGPVTAKVEAVRQNYGTPDAAIVTAISTATLTAMRSAVGTPPDAATVTEHGRRRSYRWQILGVTTATEHSELTAAAGRGPAFAPEVVSIGSVMMFRPAHHEPAIRAMERVRHGIKTDSICPSPGKRSVITAAVLLQSIRAPVRIHTSSTHHAAGLAL